MTEPSTAGTARTLAELQAGERAWFLFCADATPSLLVEPLSTDPLQAVLLEHGDRACPPDAPRCVGIAHRGEDGRVRLVGGRLPTDLLEPLSAWTRAHVRAHPGLAVLSGALLVRIDDQGRATTTDRPELWRGVPLPLTLGTLKHGATELARMQPGDNAWAWFTHRGPGGGALLTLVRVPDDPEAEQFREAVFAGIRRGASNGVRGVLHRTAKGRFVYFTDEVLGYARPIVGAVARATGVRAIQTCQVAQLDGSGLVAAEAAGRDVSDDANEIAAIDADHPRWFVWVEPARGGGHLFVGGERDLLREKVGGLFGTAHRVARGQLAAGPEAMEFRTRDPVPGLLEGIAAWVVDHHGAWPAIARLRDARHVVRDADGNVLERHRNEHLWSQVHEGGARG